MLPNNEDFVIVPLSKIRFIEDYEIDKPKIKENTENCITDNGTEIKNKNAKFTTKQKVALAMLATVEFSCFCSMSIMAPFYPKEATDKGMTDTMAGLVFSFYALITFLSSPVFGKILPRVGVRVLFIGGIFISGICSILFGTLHYVDNYYLFVALSFTIRGAEALGAASSSTAGYVLVINIFPNNGGAVRGILETFVGLGLSAGPAIGGFLFAIGGFGLPFYVVGLITACVAPLNFFLLPPSTDCNINVKTGSFQDILKVPSVIVTCMVIVMVSTTWSFLEPTLEPHFRKHNLSPSNIGLVFLLLSATYGIFSPIWGWVSDKIENNWILMSAGLALSSVSLLFLGPSPLVPFVETAISIQLPSLSALGLFVAMGLIPTYQAILDGAIYGGFTDNIGTHSIVAGLWSCVYSLGEVLGPAIGGVMVQHWGFPVASTCIALSNLFVASMSVVYFVSSRKRSKGIPIPNDSNLDKSQLELTTSNINFNVNLEKSNGNCKI